MNSSFRQLFYLYLYTRILNTLLALKLMAIQLDFADYEGEQQKALHVAHLLAMMRIPFKVQSALTMNSQVFCCNI